MTTQFGDKLVDEGNEYSIKPFPLNDLAGTWNTVIVDGEEVPRFRASSSACWRGYIATWTIEDGKLYLTNFAAKDRNRADLTMHDVFGADRLFAIWFTGELSSPFGNRISGRYEPMFEQNNVWQFEKGVLLQRFVRNNHAPAAI
ncbi:hypothetical protein [Rhodoferax sp.]|uniref:hypothetical protein n=1 Tax=Rhodoferax sp. TaxID=50421 RepID=UPI00284EF1A4|nr:hypothetical protein [Rhodoferax sp.]MDR3371202.1 hypothetical protein [Rhodoferax sp.]